MFLLHVCVVCVCCMRVLYACVACVCCLHVLYVCVVCVCCMRVLYVCVVYVCCISVYCMRVLYLCVLYACVVCVCCMSVVCVCCMNVDRSVVRMGVNLTGVCYEECWCDPSIKEKQSESFTKNLTKITVRNHSPVGAINTQKNIRVQAQIVNRHK